MKRIHLPTVDARYWAAISLASIFGTNLGDLYAHDSGLGLIPGVGLLALLVVAALLLERRDGRTHQAWYWLAIVVIRTGATNIADWLAFRVRVPGLALTLGLAALLAVLGWQATRARAAADTSGLPATGGPYWPAMLTAGVFGTVVGDQCSHFIGQGAASLVLGGLLALVLFARSRGAAAIVASYWFTVATARTAGTAIGDWIAENHLLDIGLPVATLLTGLAFVAVVLAWPTRPRAPEPATDAA